jgi:hypothetical protein
MGISQFTIIIVLLLVVGFSSFMDELSNMNQTINPYAINGSNITSGTISQSRMDNYYVNISGTSTMTGRLKLPGMDIISTTGNGDFTIRPKNITMGYWDFAVINTTGDFTFYDAISNKNPFYVRKGTPSGQMDITPAGIKSASLAGSTVSILQTNTTGFIWTNRSSGAGIPLTSPDGSNFCIVVSNLGVLSASSGSC